MFLVKSSENIPPCPCCNGSLKYRDSKKRIRKHEGGDKDYILIRRFRCTECNRYHNELPDILLPYKHYEAEVISGVIDEMVQPTDLDSEDYPCISTMMYWLLWFQKNLSNIEGYLKSIGYRFLNLGNDFLFSCKCQYKNAQCGSNLLDNQHRFLNYNQMNAKIHPSQFFAFDQFEKFALVIDGYMYLFVLHFL